MLNQQHCVPCEGGIAALSLTEANMKLAELNAGWEMNEQGTEIKKRFQFKNYYETMAFVNASAWISHQQDHHPDLEVAYNHCVVRYSTHSIGGLSNNDFICAALIEQLGGEK